MKKKQICIDARMGNTTGIGRYIRHVVPGLEDDFEIHLLLKAGEEIPSELKGFSYTDIPSTFYSLKEQIYLPLKCPPCDLFWSPHFNVPLRMRQAKKRLVTIHDVVFLAKPDLYPFHKKLYARLFLNASLKKSDHVITVSEFTKQEILRLLPADAKKITSISLGVDQHAKRDVLEPKSPYGRYVLYVGNFSIHKNVERLIEAVKFFPPDLNLVLVGRGNIQVNSSKIYILQGRSDSEIKTLYRQAEALVHPSLYEGFGLTILEAMALGLPVVASDQASIPEVGGEACVYVNPLSSRSIASGVDRVLAEKKKWRSLGLKQAEKFLWKNTIDKHVCVIKNLLEGR